MAAITVKQLRELLADSAIPDDAIVVLSEDAEGNGFSPMPADQGWSVGEYVAGSTWSGAFYDATSYADPDEDEPEHGVAALCLWPTN